MHEFAGTQWGDTGNVGTENIKPGDSRTLLKTSRWRVIVVVLAAVLMSPFIVGGFLYEWAARAFAVGRGLYEDSIEG